jgi:hypothetical protein
MLTLPSIATADHQESVYSGFKRRPLETSKLTKSKELPRMIPAKVVSKVENALID